MGANEITINSLSELQLIQLAKKSSDIELLHRLSQSSYPTVRRCVARSQRASKKTIDTLACDSALNVSFIANSNPNCTIKKSKNSEHPCVICCVDEEEYISRCGSCENLKFFKATI
ncbi:hypothetical protein CP960_06250 [Malaciobacter halophilus]|uniref:Uncharacterized protein n=1 Tax=Malaciobacter halophilus TaxID=197482 RepID=A0A2N1J3M5_9BACT|nr:hypothetical protein [Malaciobacter halophilus]AXH09044.1 hypothetical protein AHALO_0658 [Malaciobacter halophilus]PKI81158.1 hypothetical protein CP960_06250 [Malaciobacter halophilus]